jgi:hypothetical protein
MTKPTLTDDQKQQILDKQFEKALQGDPILLVHLGKAELGQTETTRHEIQPLPMTEYHLEELLEMLEDRRTGISLANTAVHLPQLIDSTVDYTAPNTPIKARQNRAKTGKKPQK